MSKVFPSYFPVIALLLLVGSILSLGIQQVSAQSSIQFTPVSSAYASSTNQKGNNTASQSLLAGNTGNGTTYYAFLKFNLSAIPDGARIESAKLVLTSTQSSGTGRIGIFLTANNSWDQTMTWSSAPLSSIFTNPSDTQPINGTAGHSYAMDVTRDVQIATASDILTEVVGPMNSTSVALIEFYRFGNVGPVLTVSYGVSKGIFYSYAGVAIAGLPPLLSTRVIVDGTAVNSIPGGGIISLELTNNTSPHKVQVDQIRLMTQDMRYFANESLMDINTPGIHTFGYRPQYFLLVYSDYGTVGGTGWYDAWIFANYEVVPPSVPVPGPFGYLGARENFVGWSGDSVVSVPAASIAMDKPHTIVAVWKADYTVFYIVMGLIIAGASGSSAYFILNKKKKAQKALQQEEPEVLPPACPHCGEPLEFVQNTPYVFCSGCKKLFDTKKIVVPVSRS